VWQAVKDSEGIRKAVEEIQPETVKFGLRLGTSKPLYQASKALRDSPEWEKLSAAKKRMLELQLRDFLLGGVALEVQSGA
jgi:oligopeptidase A